LSLALEIGAGHRTISDHNCKPTKFPFALKWIPWTFCCVFCFFKSYHARTDYPTKTQLCCLCMPLKHGRTDRLVMACLCWPRNCFEVIFHVTTSCRHYVLAVDFDSCWRGWALQVRFASWLRELRLKFTQW
jgi:hypothetical protein